MSHRYEIHQIVAADTVSLYTRAVAELGKMLDEIVMNFGAGIALAHDEMAVSKISPRYLPSCHKFVITGQRDKDPLIPQMNLIAGCRNWFTGEKGDIKAMSLDCSNVL